MKKVSIVLTSSLLLCANVYAQTDTAKIDLRKAGKELQKFSSKATTGMVLSIGGAVLIGGAAATAKDGKASTVPLIIGGGLMVFGTFIHLGAFSNAKKAGLYLTGEGITYHIKPK